MRFSSVQEQKIFSGKQGQSSGSVVLILTILLPLIMAAVVFSIELSRLGVFSDRLKQVAEHAAQRSLMAYARSDTGAPLSSLLAARREANNVGKLEEPFSYVFSSFPAAAEQIVFPLEQSEQTHGVLTPGIWHFKPPKDCQIYATSASCPCPGGAWQGACFEELKASAAGSDPEKFKLNAIQINLRLSTKYLPEKLLTALLGAERMQLSAKATAAIIPRHGVFLLDLSRSMKRDTHLNYEKQVREVSGGALRSNTRALTLAAEYAFKLDRIKDAAGNYQIASSCPQPETCTENGACLVADGKMRTYNFLFNGEVREGNLLEDQRDPAFPSEKTKHYKSDYQCLALSYAEDGKPHAANYLIDTYEGQSSDGGKYDGPEPLNTLLVGLHEALSILKKQEVPGDRIGMLGFDQSAAIDKRCMRGQGADCAALISTKEASFEDFLSVIDIEAQSLATVQRRLSDYLLFPRLDAASNLPEALKKTRQMLEQSSNDNYSQNFVLVFSDGVSTCTSSRSCSDDESGFSASFQETKGILSKDFLEKGVRVHFVLSGDYVKPHTLLAPSLDTPGSCMTEDEARTRGISLVDTRGDSSAFTNAVLYGQSASFFHPANAFFSLVQGSGGHWAPLRECCRDASGNCSDVRSQIQALCAESEPGSSEISDPYLPEGSLIPKVIANSAFTDDAGRLSCDPAGRSKREQIKNYISQLIGEHSPIVLVE